MHYCDSYKGDKYTFTGLLFTESLRHGFLMWSILMSVEMHIVLAMFFFNQFKVFGDFVCNEN